MSVQVKELLANVPIADAQGNPTAELVEIVERLIQAIRNHEARIEALEP